MDAFIGGLIGALVGNVVFGIIVFLFRYHKGGE